MNVILLEKCVFDLKINLGQIDLYFTVQWFFFLCFALKNILVLLAKLNSGELRCSGTALIMFDLFRHYSMVRNID